jgi:glycosyltransferase involved in cell wall biosynthesis
MNLLVSIIMPVYNSEKYVRDTIESCLKQSYKNIEIVIVNDGSKDSSEEIIQGFRDNRIKYYKITNSGPCYARNYGVKKASGVLFQFLDADDLLHPHKIRSQVNFYRRFGDDYGDDYVYSGKMGIITGGQKRLEKDFDFYYKNLEVKEYFREMFNHFGKYYTTGMWLVPKKLMDATHGWDQKVLINNDGEYFSRLILISKGIIYCPGAIFYYRKDVPESLSKKFNSKEIYESWLYSYTCYVEGFKANLDIGSARELGRRALSVYYCNSYPYHPDLRASCREQIKLLGYSSAAPHGGKTFKFLSRFIGTDNALRIRTLKNSGRIMLNKVRQDKFTPQQTPVQTSKTPA